MEAKERKVYYGYTSYTLGQLTKKDRKQYGVELSRATVALIKVNSAIIFGVSICHEDDTFSKVEGRKWALKRLDEDFSMFIIPTKLLSKMEGLNDHEISMFFLDKVLGSVQSNMRKYKDKIHYHDKHLKESEARLRRAKEYSDGLREKRQLNPSLVETIPQAMRPKTLGEVTAGLERAIAARKQIPCIEDIP